MFERLSEGMPEQEDSRSAQKSRFVRKLSLISTPAGFGKTTLVSEWVAGCGLPAAWLSLDEGDSHPIRFFTYLIAALQTMAARQAAWPEPGKGILGALQSPQPPQVDFNDPDQRHQPYTEGWIARKLELR
jgi:hypothetical protein